MKASFQSALVLLFCALAAPARADLRSSDNYSIATEAVDGGGNHATSANYSSDASAALITGLSTASSIETLKQGYIGQLYDLLTLSVTAPPSTSLNETASRQLVAAPMFDDETTFGNLDPSTVTWSIASGPIASISSSGLVTAGNVYQDTSAIVQGDVGNISGQLDLTVLNVGNDDFLTYGGDHINDAWQVQYFGLPPNSYAGPNGDFDGDTWINLLEYTFGTNPIVGQNNVVSYNGNLITPGSPTVMVTNTEFGVDYRAMYSRRIRLCRGRTYLRGGIQR